MRAQNRPGKKERNMTGKIYVFLVCIRGVFTYRFKDTTNHDAYNIRSHSQHANVYLIYIIIRSRFFFLQKQNVLWWAALKAIVKWKMYQGRFLWWGKGGSVPPQKTRWEINQYNNKKRKYYKMWGKSAFFFRFWINVSANGAAVAWMVDSLLLIKNTTKQCNDKFA